MNKENNNKKLLKTKTTEWLNKQSSNLQDFYWRGHAQYQTFIGKLRNKLSSGIDWLKQFVGPVYPFENSDQYVYLKRTNKDKTNLIALNRYSTTWYFQPYNEKIKEFVIKYVKEKKLPVYFMSNDSLRHITLSWNDNFEIDKLIEDVAAAVYREFGE